MIPLGSQFIMAQVIFIRNKNPKLDFSFYFVLIIWNELMTLSHIIWGFYYRIALKRVSKIHTDAALSSPVHTVWAK